MLKKIRTLLGMIASGDFSRLSYILRLRLHSFFAALRHTRNARKAKAQRPRHRADPAPRKPSVLYVTSRLEAKGGQTIRYRIFNIMAGLKRTFRTRFEIIEDGIYLDQEMVHSFDLIVLMRLSWSDMTMRLVETARRAGIPIVFDIDDIIFLPQYADNLCKAQGETDGSEILRMRKSFEEYHQTLMHSDYATASTRYLAVILEEYGRKAFVIHNGFNRRQMRIAKRHQKDRKECCIGYLSGTKTHNRDFPAALPAIERLMKENSSLRLRVTGYLDRRILPAAVAERTDFRGFVSWSRLMKISASNRINIAPLEISDPFCQAKSELKYFEAALLKIPTVASATDSFSRCIRDGVNGMLAANDEEWYQALKRLMEDEWLYQKVAQNAWEHTMRNYSPQAIADEAAQAYRKILAHSGGAAEKNRA